MKLPFPLLIGASYVWSTTNIQPGLGFTSIPKRHQGASSISNHPMRVQTQINYFEDTSTNKGELLATLNHPMRVQTQINYFEDTSTNKRELLATLVKRDDEIAAPQKTEHLVKIDFKKDLSRYIDSSIPYYALENEHAIIDDTSGEFRGIICTIKRDAPIGCETGGISFFHFLRAAGCMGSAYASMEYAVKKRFYYPATSYMIDVIDVDVDSQNHGVKFEKELSSIANSEEYLEQASSDPIFICCKCNGSSKRLKRFCGILKTKDTVWCISGIESKVSESLFDKRFPCPPPSAEAIYSSDNPYKKLSDKIQNLKISSFDKDWVTVEGMLPPVTLNDCSGHIHSLPHSVMIFHCANLIGTAIEKLTGALIPCKRNDFGQEHCLKLLSFDCMPENFHFPNTYGLKFKVKTFLSTGLMGKPTSTYCVELSVMQDVTGIVCFRGAAGRFVLQAPHVLNVGDVPEVDEAPMEFSDGFQTFISLTTKP